MTNQTTSTMTVKELRTALFEIDNQNMTVKELRALLFAVENENAEITPEFVAKLERTYSEK
jgi:Ca2+-binding EF-hand superfamily protein